MVDGGPARIGVESTIVDLTGAAPAILRAGAITASQIAAALGAGGRARGGGRVRAPGMLASHYAPRAPLVLTRDEAARDADSAHAARGRRAIPLLTLPDDPQPRRACSTRRCARSTRRYGAIVAMLPPETEANAAVRDRLMRAATVR